MQPKSLITAGSILAVIGVSIFLYARFVSYPGMYVTVIGGYAFGLLGFILLAMGVVNLKSRN